MPLTDAVFLGFSAKIDLRGPESSWRALKNTRPALPLNGHLRKTLPAVGIRVFLNSRFLVLDLCFVWTSRCCEADQSDCSPLVRSCAMVCCARRRVSCAMWGGVRANWGAAVSGQVCILPLQSRAGTLARLEALRYVARPQRRAASARPKSAKRGPCAAGGGERESIRFAQGSWPEPSSG